MMRLAAIMIFRNVPRSELVRRATAVSKRPGRFHEACYLLWRLIFGCTMKIEATGLEHLEMEDGLIIAVSHVSHLDPIVVSAMLARRISWVSRIEFYQQWLMRAILHQGGAFPVDREGAARPTIREALRRLRQGETVGIFPEGELMRGEKSVLRGAKIKQGVCLLAAHSGRPVFPVVVLGTDRLATISPWLPAKRGRLWIGVGPPIFATDHPCKRQGRSDFEARLVAEYVRLYAEMRGKYGLAETIAP